jgi:hypothetical protein
MYDANLGRFLQRDPLGAAGGVNRYGYVADSPGNAVDPLGKQELGGLMIPPFRGRPQPQEPAIPPNVRWKLECHCIPGGRFTVEITAIVPRATLTPLPGVPAGQVAVAESPEIVQRLVPVDPASPLYEYCEAVTQRRPGPHICLIPSMPIINRIVSDMVGEAARRPRE